MRKAFLIFTANLVALHVYAYDRQRSFDNLAEDVSSCAAFYMIVSAESEINSQKQNDAKWAELAIKYRTTSINAINLLRKIMVGKPEKFLDSKIELQIQQLIKIRSAEGDDRLMFLFADSCKAIMEDPDQRLKYWTDKK